MKVRVLGVQKVDYDKKNGEHVKGLTIHNTFKDANVIGDAVNADFVNDKLEIPGIYDIKPGMVVDIEYNRRGYLAGLEICK